MELLHGLDGIPGRDIALENVIDLMATGLSPDLLAQASLRVHVNRKNAVSFAGQNRCKDSRGGGLSNTALLVGNTDNFHKTSGRIFPYGSPNWDQPFSPFLSEVMLSQHLLR